MTDVNYAEPRPIASPLYLRDEELKQGVDLLFHAFSRLVSRRAKAACAKQGSAAPITALCTSSPAIRGSRSPQLLAILKITKQSLNRVLNDLLEQGFVERRPAPDDRRMRQLRLTAKGEGLEAALWEAQRPRLARAFREAGPDAVLGFRRVLAALADPERKPRGAKP